jgi:hypothetical protein
VVSATLEDDVLVVALRSILKDIDDEYERERANLLDNLPDSRMKDRALEMLESEHCQRRENYLRELAAILERVK